VHLVSAREHPAATVRRQHERDFGTLLPTIRHLTERQQQLFFVFVSVISRHVPDGFGRLLDADIADAAGALAATAETAARGVIYEHSTQSVPAEKLARELQATLASIEKEARVYDHEVATTLRAIETGAREIRKSAPGGDSLYLELLRRLLQTNRGDAAQQAVERPASPLVLP
jgi:hypothetical protein